MFDPGSSHVALLQRELKRAEAREQQLLKRVQKLENEKSELLHRVNRLEAELAEQISLNTDFSSGYPLLAKLVRCLQVNSTRHPEGRRYSELDDFFALLSFMGPHFFEIFHKQLLFPSYRTALVYRERYLEDFGIGEGVFNGDFDNIKDLLTMFLPRDYEGKLVLMIDAAYVTPYVKIYSSGKVTGLIHRAELPPEVAQEIIEDPEKFRRFCFDNKDKIVQADFVMMVAATDPTIAPIPLCCKPAKSGTATMNEVWRIEDLIGKLGESGYQIAGLATDGDTLYGRYSCNFVIALISKVTEFPDHTLPEVMSDMSMLFHFSDPFHLVKRDRYKKVRGIPFSGVPNEIGQLYSVDDLVELGIPQYLLDNDKARKMEDSLPLKLFSYEILELVISEGDPQLVFLMLPSTLLMESLHSEELSRQKRIDYLLYGASLVLLYHLVQNDYAEHASNNPKTTNKFIASHYGFTKPWCKEYISVVFAIAHLLATEPNVHLGSCGTHFLEHFFGAIRRHSQGDDTHQRFLSSMQNVLLERLLLQRLGISLDPPPRRSDSGARVSDSDVLEFRPMIEYLYWAKTLLNCFITFPKRLNLDWIAPQSDKSGFEHLSELLFKVDYEERFEISTKSEVITATGGLSNSRRWHARTQIVRSLGHGSE